jgi:hypothetical protein
VLSRDTTTPTTCVAVYYNIGFRNEPRGTGFAHLFEHMMFQDRRISERWNSSAWWESNGGLLNGSTRFDFTNYYQVVRSNVLETICGPRRPDARSADHQDNLKNQQEVVKNEVKVNVLNQPYGSFPWIDLPMAANTNWYKRAQLLRRPRASRRGDPRPMSRVLQDVLRAQQRGRRGLGRFRAGEHEGVDREIFRSYP